jgi:hypothetical protein
MRILGLIFAALISAATAQADWIGFPPEKNGSGITEEQFFQTLGAIQKLYAPSVTQEGKTFEYHLDWPSAIFGAGSNLQDGVFKIYVWGGYARAPGTNLDVLALTACHELGHLLGGEPKQTIKDSEWASSEGQSDYFAAAKCLKNFFSRDNNVEAIKKMHIAPVVERKCNSVYPKSAEGAAICKRIAMAGETFAKVLQSVSTDQTPLSLATPDRTRVSATLINTYPSQQCRIDTIFAGALCNANPLGADECDVDSLGARPRCWYRP